MRSIQTKLLLPILIGGLVVVTISIVYLFRVKAENTENAGVTTARTISNQITTLRTFYSNEIAKRAEKAGMKVNYDFAEKDNTLPLPATMVKVLGEEISNNYPGAVIRLYSRYPFPHRAATEKYDRFELQAIEQLEKDPKTPVHHLEIYNGRLSMRYAVADLMRPSCVNCHNNHPESPKRDWQVGDLRGVVEVVVPVDETDASLQASTIKIALLIGVGFILIITTVMLLVRVNVIKPLNQMGSAIEKLAAGNLTAQIENSQQDEIGQIAGSARLLLNNQRTIINELKQSVFNLTDSAAQLVSSANQQSASVSQQAGAIQQAATTLNQIRTVTNQNSEKAAAVLTLSGHSMNLSESGKQSLEKAVGEIEEIQKQVEVIAENILKLSEKTFQIGQITASVNEIAEQSNLLAVNAAIESVKVGAIGKGFAVVAGEVKSLAGQSKQATAQVRSILNEIQQATLATVKVTRTGSQRVEAGVDQINQVEAQIKELYQIVTETANSARQIAIATNQQAIGIDQIASAMKCINQAAHENVVAAKQQTNTAQNLNKLANNIDQIVSRYQLN